MDCLRSAIEPHPSSALATLVEVGGAQGAYFVYVDNLGILPLQEKPTSELLGTAARAFDGLGLTIDEREGAFYLVRPSSFST